MKNKLLLLVSLLSLFVVSALRAEVVIGSPAPDFTLTDVTGKKHSLSDFKGKTVILEWVNPECPFVKKHYESGNIPDLQKAAVADGIVWLSINSGHNGAQGDFSEDKVASWSKEVGAAPSAYFRDKDGAVGRLYDAKTTPQIYVITPDGSLVYNGAIDSIRSARKEDISKATNYVTEVLAALKAGKPIAQATTQPYGCSVKY